VFQGGAQGSRLHSRYLRLGKILLRASSDPATGQMYSRSQFIHHTDGPAGNRARFAVPEYFVKGKENECCI
jgi:hypothetical protein